MSLFNNYRVYTTLYEYIRQYMSLYNNIWVYTTVYEYCIYNNIWVHTTIFEFIGWYTIVVLQMSTLIVIVLIFDRFRSDRFVCLICLLIHATKKICKIFRVIFCLNSWSSDEHPNWLFSLKKKLSLKSFVVGYMDCVLTIHEKTTVPQTKLNFLRWARTKIELI